MILEIRGASFRNRKDAVAPVQEPDFTNCLTRAFYTIGERENVRIVGRPNPGTSKYLREEP